MTQLDAGPQRLHPAAMLGDSVRALPGAVIGMAGTVTMVRDQGIGLVLLILGTLLLIAGGFAVLGWLRFTYTVGNGEIVIESGVLGRKRRVIPFDRVQDVAIERPLIARVFSTARVKIETGGSDADEGKLAMVSLVEAQALRDLIRNPAGAGLTDEPAAAEPAEPVVFAMSGRRLLLSGLLNFSLVFVALAAGAAQYLDDFGLIDVGDWISSERAQSVASRVGVLQWLMLGGSVLILGLVSGVIRTVARDFGFMLTAGATGLRRRRGLLTLSEMVIPARRTQVGRIDAAWLSGQFGWRSLSFQTLGADRKEGGLQVAAPFARPAELLPILERAGFPDTPEDAAFNRAPPRALIRRCGPWLLMAAATTMLGLVDLRGSWLALIPLTVAVGQGLGWRRRRHAMSERALFVTGGMIAHRLWIIPYEKLQTLSVVTTPWQRRLGLASLQVDTAGAASFPAPRLIDLPAATVQPLADDLLRCFYNARAALRLPPGRSPSH